MGLKGKIRKIRSTAKNCCRNGYFIKNQKRPIQEKTILFESKNGDDLAGNIFYLLKEMSSYNDFTCYLVVRQNSLAKITAMLERYQVTGVKFVYFNSKPYYQMLALAKYIVNDTSFPTWFGKREGQVYLNTWHGTPLKKMGYEVENRAFAMGNVQKNFQIADYLLYPNDYMKEKMLNAYYLNNTYLGKVLCEGYPRNSVFFYPDRANMIREELGLVGKNISVYMPTWRGTLSNKHNTEQLEAAVCNFTLLDEMMDDNQVMYVKFHLFLNNSFDFSSYRHIKPFPLGYETYDFLNIADVLVTDYSSVFYDFANSRKKIVLFTYDRADYLDERGLYVPLDELPFPQVETAKALAEELKKPKEYDDTEFLKKYCTYDNKDAVTKIAKHIFVGQKVCKEENAGGNGKENVLVYCSNLAKNGITTSMLNLFSMVDREKANYYFFFKQNQFKNFPLRLNTLPDHTGILPLSGSTIEWNFFEAVCHKLYYRMNLDLPMFRKRMNRLYQRDFEKRFGTIKLDKIIHFTGYAPDITLYLQQSKAPKVIFAHNDMFDEYKEKKNLHLNILKHAYEEYDKIVTVSGAVRDSINKVGHYGDKVIVLQNAHNDKSILERAQLPFTVDEETKISVPLEEFEEMLASDCRKFITIGRFSHEKGHMKLISAFEKFHQSHPDTKLIIVGGYGNLYNKTVKFAQSTECAQDIYIVKSVSNPFPILQRCDLFILPSDREPLGLVLLEADTLDVPIVATDIPGSGDFLREHKGYLVENSEKGLVDGMESYMKGNVKPLHISFDEYNASILNEFDHLFD